jgi:AcrR family transcriptional regulator
MKGGCPRAILTRMASTRIRGKAPKRRTQAERRAATRAALLDATIACLVEDGYARTTTRRIAERAGLTLGAVHHHFGSKAELLDETRRHITRRWAQEFLARAPKGPPASFKVRYEELFDLSWEFYKGPYFQATLELLVAARTDPELRAGGEEAMRELLRWNEVGTQVLFPELADRPGVAELMLAGEAMMRGVAMVTFGSDADPDALWPATREHLMILGTALFGDPDELG